MLEFLFCFVFFNQRGGGREFFFFFQFYILSFVKKVRESENKYILFYNSKAGGQK